MPTTIIVFLLLHASIERSHDSKTMFALTNEKKFNNIEKVIIKHNAIKFIRTFIRELREFWSHHNGVGIFL